MDRMTEARYGHNHSSLPEQAWTKITYMAHAKGYVMVRRPGCTPFVISEKQWLEFPIWKGQPDCRHALSAAKGEA